MPAKSSYERIYSVVRRIPPGRVATYGQIAALAGLSGHARQVGYALNALPDEHDVPWHRVINAKGKISLRTGGGFDNLQRRLLEAEGVLFDNEDTVSLFEFGWKRHQCVLLDWGDTVMRVFSDYAGPMESWPTVEVMPGVAEAIQQLRRDALVCLATNATDSSERAIGAALAKVGLDTRFDRIFCYETVGHRKPSEEYFLTVLNMLGLPPGKVFMVGDDFEVDVVGAIAVGIRSVWLNLLSGEERGGSLYATVREYSTLLETLEGLGFIRS